MWKTVAMVIVAILVPILFLLLLGTKEQEKIPVSYRIIEDDKAIDSSINPYMLGKDLVIEYKSSVKPRVEGSVNYTVLDDRVIVYNYSKQHFRLIFGYSSDVYEFGATTALLGEFAEERKIEIEFQNYIDRYLNWTFTEIDSAHWYANFTFNTTVYNDIKACYNKKCTDKCWASIQANYFPAYDVSKVCNDIKNITNYPYQNLTEGVKIDKIKIDTNTGTGSFYLTFPYGFRKGEKMKFGFNSTIANTTTTTPFKPNQRAICRDGKNYIHVVWLYNSTVIKYARSTDNGASFSVIDLNASSDTKTTPHISCSGNNVVVGYYASYGLNIHVSSNNGATWTFYRPRSSGVDVNSIVGVEVRGNRIHVGYSYHNPTTEETDTVYFTSTDLGLTWGNDVTVFLSTYNEKYDTWTTYPFESIAVNGIGTSSDSIYILAAYIDNAGGSAVKFKNSTTGTTWSTARTVVAPYQYYPSMTFSGDKIYVSADNSYNVSVFNSSGDYSTWTKTQLDWDYNSTLYNVSKYASVTLNNTNITVFWSQYNSSSNENTSDIVYRNWNGVSWSPVVYLTTDKRFNTLVNTKRDWSGNCIEMVYRNGTASPYNIVYTAIGTCSAPIVDTTPPTYSLNSTNSTLAGTAVMHSLYWQDDYGLSYAIFSFDNCTGSLQNITGMSLSGTSAWSNFTVGINSTVGCTIRWCVYTNDTSNNWNGTSCLQPFSYTTTSAAQVYERNLSISFTQSVSTARSVNMQRDFSQYVYLPVQFGRYATIGRTSDISISTITEFLRNALYTRGFSTSASIVAELLRNAGYTRETSTSISTVTDFFRTASYGRSISTGISALVEFFKLIKPLDYCFEIRRDGNTVTCVKDKVSQVNCLDITDINNWIYICELADRMLMVIKL